MDAWGRVAGSSRHPMSLVVTICTAVAVAIGNGVAPWSLILTGGPYALWLPFAAIGVLIGVEVYALVQVWFDFPNVSRGIGIGIALGALVFLAMLVVVVRWLGTG